MARRVDLSEAPEGSDSQAYSNSALAYPKVLPMSPNIGRILRLLAVSLVSILALPKLVEAGKTYNLQSRCQRGGVYSVAAKIQVDGTLKPTAAAKSASLPITVQGEFTYDEMRLDDGKTADRRSLRYYHEVGATIQVDKHRDAPTLRDDMRLIAVHSDKTGVAISSPHGPLTREELDLIDLPGNTLVLDGLLPNAKEKIGDSWKIGDAALAKLVCVDLVSRNEVTCELTDVVGSAAEIKIVGQLNAAVGGVATEIGLDGNAAYDLDKHCLTSIQLRIKERRSVGYVTPGMDVTAELTLRIKPVVASRQLTPTVVKESRDADPAASPLALRSAAGAFHLIYDRRWHVTRDEAQLIVLRLIDRGELIAQCNISPLPALDQGKTLSIEEFQADVRQSLGKRLQHIDTVAVGKGAHGMRILKVFASGVVSEIPIQWRYYVAIDPDGRRLAIAYTMESDLIERFADADTAMTESIEFDAATATNQPTKADATVEK